jgi:hypothetical protein
VKLWEVLKIGAFDNNAHANALKTKAIRRERSFTNVQDMKSVHALRTYGALKATSLEFEWYPAEWFIGNATQVPISPAYDCTSSSFDDGQTLSF